MQRRREVYDPSIRRLPVSASSRGPPTIVLTPNVQGNRRAAPMGTEDQNMNRRVRLTVRLGVTVRLQRRPRAPARMPKRDHLNSTAPNAIVEVIANSGEVQAPHPRSRRTQDRGTIRGSVLRRTMAFARSSSKASGARSRCSSHHSVARSIWACARLETRTFTAYLAVSTGKLREHLFADTVSPRSASAIERSSSCSCSGVKSKLPSSSLARTVTEAPSSREIPSRTIFPPTTFPLPLSYAKDTPVRVARRFDTQRNQVNRRAATGVREKEGPYRRVRLNAWLAK